VAGLEEPAAEADYLIAFLLAPVVAFPEHHFRRCAARPGTTPDDLRNLCVLGNAEALCLSILATAPVVTPSRGSK